MKLSISDNAQLIFDILELNGFECYAVGGCVRDAVLKRAINDYDFTTNATPDEILSAFSLYTTIDIGKKYGTIAVVIDGETFEITTYRTDGEYNDSRHPDDVNFSSNLSDDLSRRDFTINALAYNEHTGIVDMYGGLSDLEAGVIRCIGDADVRFSEDSLRILRALRFASTYGFSIDSLTSQSIFKNKAKLLNIKPERICSELSRLLCGDNVDFILREYKEVIAVFIPEITSMFDFSQNSIHHDKDLWEHTVSSVKNIEADPMLRMTMLLHDLGKPMTIVQDTDGTSHYLNHQKLSLTIANDILRRLRFSNDFIDRVLLLVEYHSEKLLPDKPLIKRYLRDIGTEAFISLLKVCRADILAQSQYNREEKLSNLDNVSLVFSQITADKECYCLRDLAVNGTDIMNLGNVTGEQIGFILNTLLDMVINGAVANSKSNLIATAIKLLQTK